MHGQARERIALEMGSTESISNLQYVQWTALPSPDSDNLLLLEAYRSYTLLDKLSSFPKMLVS